MREVFGGGYARIGMFCSSMLSGLSLGEFIKFYRTE